MDSEGAELNQPLGECSTPAGRSLAWVNSMQHQVQPFELADPSRPGHRKILCFFLVDGATRVPSTATCPPQQADWMAAELLAMPLFFRLPKEVFAKIAGLVVANDAAPTPSPRVSLSTDVGQWLRWVGDPLDREPQGQWEEGIGPGASEKVEGLLREALGAAGLPETVDGVLQLMLGPREAYVDVVRRARLASRPPPAMDASRTPLTRSQTNAILPAIRNAVGGLWLGDEGSVEVRDSRDKRPDLQRLALDGAFLGRREAEVCRELLMAERGTVGEDASGNPFTREFSLCEH